MIIYIKAIKETILHAERQTLHYFLKTGYDINVENNGVKSILYLYYITLYYIKLCYIIIYYSIKYVQKREKVQNK